MVKTVETLSIDPEFEGLCRKLTPEELKLLEENLIEDGCREPIVIWRNKGVILDGHNRYSICQKHAIPFEIKGLSFTNRGDAINWIIANQLGKRNLTEEEKSYLRGKQYGIEKKRAGAPAGNKNAEKQPGQAAPIVLDATNAAGEVRPETTAQRLAEEHGVDPRTIRRDEEFAESVDQAAAKAPEVKQAILAGNVDKKDVPALAEAPADQLTQLANLPPDQQRKAAKEIAQGATPEAAAAKGAEVVDATKRVVPKRLEAVFSQRGEFRDIARVISTLRKRLDALAEQASLGVFLEIVELRTFLDNAHHSVKFSTPYAVCPYCKGKGGKCDPCRGSGWVNETVYRNAPTEMRE